MSTRRTPLITKLLISFISFTIALALLELGLRVTGYLILAERGQKQQAEHSFTPPKYAKKETRILATGDSFIFGGESKWNETFSYHLKKRLKKLYPNESIGVINKGICEATSSRILRSFPEFLEEYDPSVVLLLVGSTNRFNHWDNRQLSEKAPLKSSFLSTIHTLRVVKAAEILWLDLESKFASQERGLPSTQNGDSKPISHFNPDDFTNKSKADAIAALTDIKSSPNSPLEKIWYLHNARRAPEAIALARKILATHPENAPIILANLGYIQFESGDWEAAKVTFAEAVKQYPGDDWIQGYATEFYGEAGEALFDGKQFADSVDYLLNALRFPSEDTRFFFHQMCQAFVLQDRYDASTITDRLQAIEEQNPALKDQVVSSEFTTVFTVLQDISKQYKTSGLSAAIAFGNDLAEKKPQLQPLILANIGYLQFRSDDWNAATKTYNAAQEKYPEDPWILGYAAFYYEEVGLALFRERKFGDAIEFFLRSIPFNIDDDQYYFYNIAKAFAYQSRFDAPEIVRRLEEIGAKKPGLKTNASFIKFLEIFRNKEEWDTSASRWLELDLEDIVALCQDAGVQLVLQTYPVHYPNANRILHKIAEKYDLPLVDHTPVFDKLERRDYYILDDDHCSSAGHDIMAKNAIRVLVAEGILPPSPEASAD